jgi:hypothetical protein
VSAYHQAQLAGLLSHVAARPAATGPARSARQAAFVVGMRGSGGVVSGDTDLGDLRGQPQTWVPDPGAAIGQRHPARSAQTGPFVVSVLEARHVPPVLDRLE